MFAVEIYEIMLVCSGDAIARREKNRRQQQFLQGVERMRCEKGRNYRYTRRYGMR